MIQGNKSWVHSGLDMAIRLSCNSQQFQAIAKLTGKSDVLRTDVINAFPVNILIVKRPTKGQRNNNGQFMGSITSVNIQGGICLRITEPLRY